MNHARVTYSYPRGRAFTLLEVIVVVAVITLLIALVLPAISNAGETSKRVKCGANLRSLSTTVAVYRLGHRDDLPVAENPFDVATGLVQSVVCQPLEAMRSELDFSGEWGNFAPARCPSDLRVAPRIGVSYYYMPSVLFGFLSQQPAAQRDSRINEVERIYRLGFYTDLWTEIDRSGHTGQRRDSDLAYQIADMDGAVRFVQVRGVGGFDLGPWLAP